MTLKLHCCGWTWARVDGHACWRVQKALDEQGVEYELVKERTVPRGARKETIERTGQNRLPWLELADGTVVRRESKELAEEIRAGRLPERPPAA